jgi:hypothetical protein
MSDPLSSMAKRFVSNDTSAICPIIKQRICPRGGRAGRRAERLGRFPQPRLQAESGLRGSPRQMSKPWPPWARSIVAYGAAVAQMAVATTVVGALLTWKKTDH